MERRQTKKLTKNLELISMKKILETKLHWRPKEGSENEYVNDHFPYDDCHLRMNDFPEEIMWSLFFHGEQLDFDETPKKWTFSYRFEIDDHPIQELGTMEEFLEKRLHWISFPDRESDYYCENINSENCFLRMNNGDVEIWTIYYNGQTKSFDDLPDDWSIVI